MRGEKFDRLSDTAKIVRCPPLQCERTRKVYVDLKALEYQVTVHNDCVCNEKMSLYNRHLVDRAQDSFSSSYVTAKFKEWLKYHALPKIDRVPYQDVVNGYSGAKKRAYAEAREWLLENSLAPANTRVQMFVKPDKYARAQIYDKAPRAIQFRGPKFNLELATYLKPMEHWCYEHLSHDDMRQFAKGLRNSEKGELLLRKWDMFSDPVAVLLDHSKFDSCINAKLLRLTHRLYKRMNKSRHLSKLLDWMVDNRGYTKGGIKYRVKGTRMSGDYDTAFGNSLLNYVILFGLFGKKAQYLIDGDDSVVIMERRWWNLCRVDMDHFRRFNMTTKYEVVDSIEAIEFCQLRMMSTGVFVRDRRRALAHLSVSLAKHQGKAKRAFLAGKAYGLAHQSPRDPILFPVFIKLANSLGVKSFYYDTQSAYHVKTGKLEPPTMDDELAYCDVFGISLSTLEAERRELLALIDSEEILRCNQEDYTSLPFE